MGFGLDPDSQDMFVDCTRNSFWVPHNDWLPTTMWRKFGLRKPDASISRRQQGRASDEAPLRAIDQSRSPNLAFAVNSGDTMKGWTKSEWKYARPRVIHRSSQGWRISVPFFEPGLTTKIAPLQSFEDRIGWLKRTRTWYMGMLLKAK